MINKDLVNPVYRSIFIQLLIITTVLLLVSAWMYFGDWEEVREKPFGYLFMQGLTGVLFFILPAVYLNIYWLIPSFLVVKKHLTYFLLCLFFVISWGSFVGVAEPWTDQYWFGDGPQELNVAGGIIVTALLIIAATLLNLAYRWFVQTSKIRQMENDHLQMELSLLRNQINPHFFFNTLNNLYALSLDNAADTSKVILKLSEMMRYTIYECKEPLVSMEREITYIENYLALEQIRQFEDAEVTFQLDGSGRDVKIAPMILVVFIENAFKHGFGSMTDGAYIHILLKTDGDGILFSVENNYRPEGLNSGGGVGIENVRRRLALLYSENHLLQINDNQGVFSLSLQINQHD